MGGGGPGIGSPRGLPQRSPSPSQKALHLLSDHWSVEVWLPQDSPCPSLTSLGHMENSWVEGSQHLSEKRQAAEQKK